MSIETDKVLSAIRRGEDSLPKLRAATGLEYAQLHTELYNLEFEWRSIQRNETADGFSRYVPTPSEKSNGGSRGVDWKDEQPKPITPTAFAQTKASNAARAVALLQRDAPYCVKCRGLCIFDGVTPEGRTHWRCRACNEIFDGSSVSVMAHIEPDREPKPATSATEETCVDCGKPRSFGSGQRCRACYLARAEAKRGIALPEDEPRIAEEIDHEPADAEDDDEEIENWRIGMCRKCGDPAITKTGNICQKHKAIEDAIVAPCADCKTPTTAKIRNRRIGKCQECYKVYMKGKREQSVAAKQNGDDAPKEICGCGRELPHGGRCSARRNNPKATNVCTPKLGKIIAKPITSNGTKPATESTQPERAQVVTPGKSEDRNRDDLAAKLLSEIAEREAQLVTLEQDLAALRRVSEMLGEVYVEQEKRHVG